MGLGGDFGIAGLEGKMKVLKILLVSLFPELFYACWFVFDFNYKATWDDL